MGKYWRESSKGPLSQLRDWSISYEERLIVRTVQPGEQEKALYDLIKVYQYLKGGYKKTSQDSFGGVPRQDKKQRVQAKCVSV